MLDARGKRDTWFQVTISEWQSRLIVAYTDVTVRVKREEGWRHAGFQDALTGAYNRRYFLEHAAELISLSAREGWSVGLLYLDLDNFKRINDSFGHGVGDLVLTTFAERITSVVRSEDIFFRIGGDEFGVFLAKTTSENAGVLVERIRQAVTQPVQLPDGSDYSIGVAVGVCVRNAREATAAILLSESDRAMYAAKRG